MIGDTNGKGKPSRPIPPAVQLDNIPSELIALPQWVAWRYALRDEKWTKPPLDCHTGREAKSTDPATWSSFDEAVRFYQAGKADGIGFVFSASDPYAGIDLDDCRDESGPLQAWAKEIVGGLSSYAEVSPSGRGVKIIVRGQLPPKGRRRKGDIEMYSESRYFTITGRRLETACPKIEERPSELLALHTRLFGQESNTQSHHRHSANGNGSESEIIARATRAENGDLFARLWQGDTTGYSSRSEADLALCSLLAFWVGPDPGRIDQLFRQSGLYREKWDRQDYRERTIGKALEGRTDFYKASRERRPEQSSNGHQQRPKITISAEEYKVNYQAAKALVRDATIYQRGGQLVRVVRDDSPARHGIRRPIAPRIDAIPAAILRDRLTAVADWVTIKVRGDDIDEVPAHPPGWCVNAVCARGAWPGIRHLEAVVDCPVLRPDGTILCEPGYDASTGLLLEPAGTLPVLKDRPTHHDAVAARDRLLEIIDDFPFAAKMHKAAWLAALLTPLSRFAFTGPAPLFLADANVRGSGKGLLLDLITAIATGERFTVATYTNDQDELRKRITSLAMSGDRLVLLDNIEGKLGNAVLDAALTATSWEDRILGVNRMARCPLYVTWYATGNNVIVGADTTRRICHIRLESPEERPEERRGFAHPDLRQWVLSHRHELLADALTILRAYFLAGRPDQHLQPWGSFEAWSAVVRNSVVWLELPDPGATRIVLADQADTTAQFMATLLRCLEQLDPERRGLTTAEIVELAKVTSGCQAELKDAIEGLAGRLDSRILGYKLRSYRRRMFGGKYLDHAGRDHQAVRWVVRDKGAFQGGDNDAPRAPHPPQSRNGDGEDGEDVAASSKSTEWDEV